MSSNGAVAADAGPEPAIASVSQGAAQGAKVGGLNVFRGVPYARAERFGPPLPFPPWKGVRQAIDPGPTCPQLPSRLEFLMGALTATRAMAEACHVVSIWSPDLRGKRPVMVWIHGGAFVEGGGEEALYDASKLAREGDVVTVTVTYRVGAFGFLCTDGLGATNLGLQDQIAALDWVRDNIASFGGDPDNVTAFGQSAGGYSIASILATTKRPLFRRAIIQSAPVAMTMTEADARVVGRDFLAALGKSPAAATVEEMLMAQKQVLAASKLPVPFLPIGVDPLQPLSPNGRQLDVIAGWTRDDASPYIALSRDGDARGDVLDDPLTSTATRQTFSEPTRAMVETLRRQGHRVYNYEITWRPPGSPYGACHCIELPLLLGEGERAAMLSDGPQEEIERFGREARAIWTDFAKSGEAPRQTDWLRTPA
jgi:para-nitrobenzyl esterase